MNDEVRRLLGGYATGTLSEEERQILYESALEDSALFEAMADEQALKSLLDDPAARAEILGAVTNQPFSVSRAFVEWLERPKAKLLTAVAAILVVAIAVRTIQVQPPVQVAQVRHTPPVLDAPAPQQPSQESPSIRTIRPDAVAKRRAAAPAPPPAATPEPSNQLAEITASDSSPIRYTVLRLTSSGDYAPVPPGYAFARDDRARLRIQSGVPGMLLVTTGDPARTLFAGTVSADSPLLVPSDITFTEPDASSVSVAFSPAPAESSESLRYAPSAGLVGGVPRAQKAEREPVRTIEFKINLRRK